MTTFKLSISTKDQIKRFIEVKSLQEIKEFTKNKWISKDGLEIMIDKLIYEIEQIKNKIEK